MDISDIDLKPEINILNVIPRNKKKKQTKRIKTKKPPKPKLHKKKTGGKGKQKIPMMFIEDAQKRNNTLAKRLKGGMKKDAESSILGNLQVLAIRRNPYTGKFYVFNSLCDSVQFLQDFMYQYENNADNIEEYTTEDYGRGLEQLHNLHIGVKKPKKAGRPPKIDLEKLAKEREARLATMSQEERERYFVMENLKAKEYITYSLINRGKRYDIKNSGDNVNPNPLEPWYQETTHRIMTDNFAQEVHTLRGGTVDSLFEVSRDNNVEKLSETDFRVRSTFSVMLEQTISTINTATSNFANNFVNQQQGQIEYAPVELEQEQTVQQPQIPADPFQHLYSMDFETQFKQSGFLDMFDNSRDALDSTFGMVDVNSFLNPFPFS